MDNALKILGILFLLVWTAIGALILASLVATAAFVYSGEPQRMMQNMMGSLPIIGGGAPFGMMGIPSGMERLMQGSEQLKSCASKALGAKRVEELLQGKSAPKEDEISKLMSACGSMMEQEAGEMMKR